MAIKPSSSPSLWNTFYDVIAFFSFSSVLFSFPIILIITITVVLILFTIITILFFRWKPYHSRFLWPWWHDKIWQSLLDVIDCTCIVGGLVLVCRPNPSACPPWLYSTLRLWHHRGESSELANAYNRLRFHLHQSRVHHTQKLIHQDLPYPWLA